MNERNSTSGDTSNFLPLEGKPTARIVPKWIFWIIATAGTVGLADASYLTAKHFQGTPPPCVLFSGCDVVTTSSYAVIFGIPVALLGVLFYLAVLILSIAYIDRGAPIVLKAIAFLGVMGFIFSLFLVYLQLFVLDAICIYCMMSALTSTVIFALSLFAFKMQKIGAKTLNKREDI